MKKYISILCGILSILSFIIYFYSANHAPYSYIDIIILGPILSTIGMIISFKQRHTRHLHYTTWISGILLCLIGFIATILIIMVCILFLYSYVRQ